MRELKAPNNAKALVEKWAAAVVAGVKNGGGRVGDTLVYESTPGVFGVEIEHNLGGEPIYPSHKNLKVVSVTPHDGWYDWDADVYVKPCHVFTVSIEKA